MPPPSSGVDPATGAVTQVASGGQLTDPWGVAFGPGGRLFVADVGFADAAGIVFRINANSGAKIQYAVEPPLVDPAGIADARDGSLLVADINGFSGASDGLVHRVDAQRRGVVATVASGPRSLQRQGLEGSLERLRAPLRDSLTSPSEGRSATRSAKMGRHGRRPNLARLQLTG